MGVIVSFCVCVHMRTVCVPKDQCSHNEYKGRGWTGEGRDDFPCRRSLRIIPVIHHEELQSHWWFCDGWEPSPARVLQLCEQTVLGLIPVHHLTKGRAGINPPPESSHSHAAQLVCPSWERLSSLRVSGPLMAAGSWDSMHPGISHTGSRRHGCCSGSPWLPSSAKPKAAAGLSERWAGGDQPFPPWSKKHFRQLSLSGKSPVPTLNSKSCLLLWKFRFILLLFLHINPEFNSCFSPSAISHVWSLSLAQNNYFSYFPIIQGDPNYLKTSIPPLCSYLELSRDPGQTHSQFCLLVPPPLNSFLCVVLGFLLQTGKGSDPWIWVGPKGNGKIQAQGQLQLTQTSSWMDELHPSFD